MHAARNIDLCREVILRWRHVRRVKKVPLLAPFLAVGVYVGGDMVAGFRYEGYSFKNQAISELSAFGSPVRPLMVAVILIHNVSLLGFGFGLVWIARRRSLRWVGLLQVAEFVLVGIATHTFWAMSSRGMGTGFNDAMHIALSGIFSLIVVAMMALSAVTYPGWFRIYSLATIAVVIGFGMAASFAIRGIEQNDTPWAGGFERINAYAYFAWLLVLAITVIRRELPPGRFAAVASGSRSGMPIQA